MAGTSARYGPPPPRLWQSLSPEEKIDRLKTSFARNSISLEELEDGLEKALLEEEDNEPSWYNAATRPRQARGGRRSSR